MNGKLDLSALETLNIPEYKADPKDEISDFTEEQISEIKEEVINEVDSLEEFLKDAPQEIKGETKEDKTPPRTSLEAITDTISEETSKDTSNENKSEENKEISVIQGLSEWARSENIFDYKDEDFEDSTDFLRNKIDEISEKKAEEKLKELPEVIYEIAKNYKEGVPLDELIYSKSREIEYNGITEDQISESKELQKKLITDYLMNSDPDITDEKIAKKLQKFEDSLLLEDEAKEAHEKLVIFEKKYQERLKDEQKQRIKQNEEDFQKKLSQVESEIMGTDEFIPGIKETKESKRKIFEGYTKSDRNGETALMKEFKNNPKLWYSVTKFVLEMKGNLDSVKTKLKTEISKDTKKGLNTYQETPGLSKINLSTMKKAIEISKKQRGSF